MTIEILVSQFSIFFLLPEKARAAFNQQINYQGKLTNSSNIAVPNGIYHMRFFIYNNTSGATSSAIWTEDRSTQIGNRVTVTNGLFSVMLGSSTPLTGINFDQTLYLGVEVGGSSTTPVWDGEMSPRKVLGTVPAAFVAQNLSGGSATTTNLLVTSSSTLQNFTAQNSTTTSATTTNLFSNIANIVNLFTTSATTTNATSTNLFSVNISGTNANLESLLFTKATGTQATTTNLFSTTGTFNNLFYGTANGGAITSTGLGTFANILVTGSSTLQNLTFTNATGTQATTTNIFSNTGTLTNLNFTTGIGSTINLSGLGTLANLLVTGSSTLQNFTFTNATGTQATTTNLFSTTGTFNNLFASNETVSGIGTLGNLLVLGSSTLQNFTFQNATGTNLVVTNLTSTYSTTTALHSNGLVTINTQSGNYDSHTGSLLHLFNTNIKVNTNTGYSTGLFTDNTIYMAANQYMDHSSGTFKATSNGASNRFEVTYGNTGFKFFAGANASANTAVTNTEVARLWQSGGFSLGNNFISTDPGLGSAIFQNKIGVATTAPSQELSVGGNTYITGGLGVGKVNTSAGSLETSGSVGAGTNIFIRALLNCNNSASSLQTDGSGQITCGTITAIGGTSAGGWTWVSPNKVQLATTTDQVVIGTSSSSPYAKFFINSGSVSTTTFALSAVSGQTANILDIYDNSTNLTSVITGAGLFGFGTTTPKSRLAISGGASIGADYNISAPTNGLIVEGNVGIGTTSPATKLHVEGTNTVARILNTSVPSSSISQTINGLEIVTSGAMTTTNKYAGALKFGSADIDLTSTNPKLGAMIAGYGTENYTSDGASGMGLEFFTTPNGAGGSPTPTSRMVIDQNGNVGISTSTPTYRLSVEGSSTLGNEAIAGYFTATSTSGVSTFRQLLALSSSTLQNFTFQNATGTQATTTNFFSTNGTFTNLFYGTASGGAITSTALGTFANLLVNGSSTLQNFTFQNATGTQATTTNFFSTNGTFTNLFSTNLSVGSLTGPLQAVNGVVSASSTLSVAYGGTGSNSFAQGGWLYGNGTGAVQASSSPTVGWLVSTSTTATSTFAGGLSAASSLYVLQNGNTGIGTTTPASKLAVSGGASIGANYNISAPTNGLIVEGNVGIGNNNPSTYIPFGNGLAVGNTVNQRNSLSIVGNVTTNDNAFGDLNFYNNSTRVAAIVGQRSGSDTSGALYFYTATSGALNLAQVINNVGNVGIGSTSPYTKLGVAGTVVADNFVGTTTASSTFAGPVQALTVNTTSLVATSTFAYSILINSGCIASPVTGYLNATTTCLGSPGTIFPRWNDLQSPTQSLSMNMGIYPTLFNWTTGSASNNLFSFTTDNSANGTGNLVFIQSGNGSTIKPFRVLAGNTEAIAVDTLGNVGIGTTSPTGGKLAIFSSNGTGIGGEPSFVGTLRILDTKGDTGEAGGIEFKSSNAGSGYGWRITNPDIGGNFDNLFFQRRANSSSWTNAVTFQGSTGNVGIGTTSPYAKTTIWGIDTSANTRSFEIANSASTTLLSVNNAGLTSLVNLLATSSSTLQNFTAQTGTLNNLVTLSSSTLQNFTFTNATGTQATTTNFFSTNGTFTNLYATSAFTLSGAGKNMLLSTDSSGNVVSTGTPQVAAINATSTTATSTFSGGLSAASSLYVLQNGNVGIGTTNPGYTLDVNGTANALTYRLAGGVVITRSGVDTQINTDSFYQTLGLFTNGTEKVRINSAGNVGIGTTSPAYKLHIQSGGTTNAPLAYFNNGSASAEGLEISHSGSSGSSYGINNAVLLAATYLFSGGTFRPLGFVTSNSTRLLIDASGNVGIGTTAPGDKLHVAGGNIIIEGSASGPNPRSIKTRYTTNDSYSGSFGWNGLQLGNNGTNYIIAGNTASGGALAFVVNNTNSLGAGTDYGSANGTTAMFINSSGNVGIGTTGLDGKLSVVGSAASAEVKLQIANTDNTGYEVLRFSNSATGLGQGYIHYFNPSWATSGAWEANSLAMGGNVINLAAYGASGNIKFYTGGTASGNERVRIDQNGNVGIGLTSPNYKLEVNGTASTTALLTQTLLALSSSTLQNFTFTNATGTQATTTNFFSTNGTFTNLYATSAFTLSGAGKNMLLSTDSSGNVVSTGTPQVTAINATSTTATSTFSGGLSAASSLYVLQNGNVGIGTTTPLTTFSVSGQTTLYGTNGFYTTKIGSAAGGDSYVWLGARVGVPAIQAQNGAFGSAQNLVLQNEGGNVGIGTTAPAGKFHLSHTTAEGALALILQTNNSSAGNGTIRWKNDAGNNQAAIGSNFNVSDPGALEFLNGNTTNMIIRSTGNVGIGTTSPMSKLAVSGGNLVVANSGGTEVRLYDTALNNAGISLRPGINGATPTAHGFSIYDNNANVERVSINSSGNVGIGTTSPTGKLNVYNSTSATGSVNDGTLFIDQNYSGLVPSQLTIRGSSGSGNQQLMIGYNTTSDYGSIQVYKQTQSAKNLALQAVGGNVGIGTTTPNNKLDIYDTSKSAIGFSGASGSTYKWTIGMDVTNGGRFSIASSTALGTTDRFVIDGAGNVGIGVTAPASTLEIKPSSGDSTLRVHSQSGNDAFVYIEAENAGGADTSLCFGDNSTLCKGRIYYGINNSSASDNYMNFYTNGAQKMTIDPNGNVGIGTTTPYGKLSVSGTGAGTAQFVVDPGSAGANRGVIYIGSNASFANIAAISLNGDLTDAGLAGLFAGGQSNTYLQATAGGDVVIRTNGNSTTATFKSGGNVGIGTTNPGTKLEIYSAGAGYNRIADFWGDTASAFNYIKVGKASGGASGAGAIFGHSAAGGFAFMGNLGDSVADGTQGLVIKAGGNTGIGTTNPLYKLEVNGTASATALTVPQTINSTTGVINMAGSRFIHAFKPSANDGFNTFVGLNAGNFTMGSTTGASYLGSYNTALGNSALQANTTGYYNTASGYQALFSNTTGIQNTASGYLALTSNTTGNYNTANGVNALYSNTTGNYNTATGLQALYSNTTGSNNTANGMYALYSNTTGNYNTANSMYALFSNTTGSNNTANGYAALYSNTTGNYDTANGMYALYSNTTGNNNTASGYAALYFNTTGSYNGASGMQALYSNTTGSENTASGYEALFSNTTGSYNSASGYSALYSNTTGSDNTAIGYSAGRYIADGTTANATSGTSVYLGNATKALADGGANEIVIGYNATGNGSNSVTLGNTSITKTVLRGNVGIGTTAPGDKLHVAGTTPGIEITNNGDRSFDIRVGAVGTGKFDIADLTAGASRLTIDSSGNVGIGTNPSYKLDVAGTLHVNDNSIIGPINPQYPYQGALTWQSDNTGYYYGLGYQKTDGTNKKLQMWWIDNVVETNVNSALNIATPGHTFDGTAPNSGRTIGARITSGGDSYFTGGNVGIGTTTPTQKLTVWGTGSASLAITNTAGGSYLLMGNQDSAGVANPAVISSSNGSLYFGHGNNWYNATGGTVTNSMFIASGGGVSIGSYAVNSIDPGANSFIVSGNVGIGTTTPSSILSVGNTNGIMFSTATSTFSSTGGINLANGGCFALNSVCLTAYNGVGTLGAGTTGQVAYYNATNNAVGTSTLFISTASNVGIKTTNPGAFLQIGQANTDAEFVRLSTSYDTSRSARGGINWHDTSNTTGRIFTEYDGSMVSMNFGSLYNSGYNSNTLMTIRGNGNVGIATTTPFEKLTVSGNAYIAGNITATGTVFANVPFNYLTTPTQVPSINMSTYSTLLNWTTGTGSNDLFRLGTDTSANGTGYLLAVNTGNSANVKPLHITAGTNEAMAIDTSGRTGLGTTTPGARLDVYQVTGQPGAFFSDSAGGTGGTLRFISAQGGGNTFDYYIQLFNNARTATGGRLHFSGANGANDTLDIDLANQRVGIGSTTPSTTLVVAGTTTSQTIVPDANLTYSLGTSAQRYSTIWAGTTNIGTSTWSISNGNDGRLTFNNAANSAGTETVSLATNGNVGIGQTNPQFTLDVMGNQNFVGTPTSTSVFRVSALSPGWASGNTTIASGQIYKVDNSTVVNIGSSGIKIGKYTATDVSWYPATPGTFWDSSFYTSSYPNMAGAMLDSSRIAIVYNYSSWGAKVVVCTLGESTVASCGTPVTISTNGQPMQVDIKRVNSSGDFIVAAADNFGGTGIKVLVGSTSGNTITPGSVYTLNDASQNISYVQIMPFSATTTQFAMKYYVPGTDKVLVMGITGTSTVSFGQKEYLQTTNATQTTYGNVPLSATSTLIFPVDSSIGAKTVLLTYTSTSTIATSTIGFLTTTTANPTSATILDSSTIVVGYGPTSGTKYRTFGISSSTIISTGEEQTTGTGVGYWMFGISPTSFMGSNNSSVAIYKTRDMSKNYSIEQFNTPGVATLLAGQTINSGIDVPLDSTKHVAILNQGSSITLMIGTRSGTNVTYGQSTILSTSTGSTYQNISAAKLDANTFVLVKSSNSSTASAYVCSVAGTVITCGSPNVFFNQGTGAPIVSVASLDSTHFVTAYASSTGSVSTQTLYTAVASVSGTTITFGTPVALGTDNLKFNGINVAAIAGTNTKFVVAYDNSVTGVPSATNTARVIVGSVSGTNITLGQSANVIMATSTAYLRVVSPSLDTFVVFGNTSAGNDMFATFGSISGQSVISTSTTAIGKVTSYSSAAFNVSLLDSTHILVQASKELRVIEVNGSGITNINSLQTINTQYLTSYNNMYGVWAIDPTSAIALFTTSTPDTQGTILTLDNNAYYYQPKSLVIKQTGNDIEAATILGIGTANPLYTLHVQQSAAGAVAGFSNSSGYCTINPTATALSCTSDARLKTNISQIASSTEIIRRLRGVNFSWKNDATGANHIGFIAQEVQAVVPELVDQDANGILSVNYLNFAPILVNAWNALDVRVTSLESIATSTLPATSTPMLSVTDKGLGIGTLEPNFALHAKFGSDGVAVFENNNGVCEINPNTGSFGCAPNTGVTVATSTIGTNIASSTEIIRKLRGVKLSLMGASTTAEQLGFIADDVEMIAPELVATVGGVKLVKITDIIPLLVNSVADLAQKVDSLDERVAKLEAFVASSTEDFNNGSGDISASTTLKRFKEQATSTTIMVSGSTDTNFIVNAIITAFQNMGTQISLGMARFSNLFADSIVVGSPERPTGITLYDVATHQPYCLRVENGGQVTAPGTCADTLFPGTTQPKTITITSNTTSTTTATSTSSVVADTTNTSTSTSTATTTSSTATNTTNTTSTSTATTNTTTDTATTGSTTPTASAGTASSTVSSTASSTPTG